MRDLKNNLAVEQSIAPAAATASADGSGVDLANFFGALVVITAGAWTDGTHTFEVQESDDDQSFTAVADGDLIGTEPVVSDADSASQVYTVGYIGMKRYVRVSVTVAGASTGAVYGANIIKGGARKAPVE